MNINVVIFEGLGGSTWSHYAYRYRDQIQHIPNVNYCAIREFQEWPTVAKQIATFKDPFVLIGHSFGVTAALAAARRGKAQIAHVVIIDPSQYWASQPVFLRSGGNAVPDNIAQCTNFYQVPWFPWGIGGQKVYRDDHSERGITNTRVYGVGHLSIPDAPTVVEKALKAVHDTIAGR